MSEILEGIGLCFKCNGHLSKAGKETVPHASKEDKFYHSHCAPDSYAPIDYTAFYQAMVQPKKAESLPELPPRAYKVSAWTDPGITRLEQGLGLSRRDFEKTFEGVE